MKMDDISSHLWNLKLNERVEVYKGRSGTIVTATRTDKVCPHDFKVGLVIPGRDEFFPTHVRLLFDLYLKNTSNPEQAHKLFLAFEKIYDKLDPNEVFKELETLAFDMQLDDADVNLFYGQLLMVEQEFNYGPKGCKEGKVQPPREFLTRFVRWIASGEDEIDKVITNAVRNWPPPVRFKQRLFDGHQSNLP